MFGNAFGFCLVFVGFLDLATFSQLHMSSGVHFCFDLCYIVSLRMHINFSFSIHIQLRLS